VYLLGGVGYWALTKVADKGNASSLPNAFDAADLMVSRTLPLIA